MKHLTFKEFASMGGKARAKKLTAEQRLASSRKGYSGTEEESAGTPRNLDKVTTSGTTDGAKCAAPDAAATAICVRK